MFQQYRPYIFGDDSQMDPEPLHGYVSFLW